MARKARFSPEGVPQHVIQRGNNRQICFGSEEDFKAYLHWLKQYSKKYGVSVHAWVLMTNHVHLLCTPWSVDGLSKMMQSLGRSYVRYFNDTYQRTGTLWEGRFKSCLVNAPEYLFHLYRYIELNPVRAMMVDDPADYIWSSYQCNGLGKQSILLSPHELYQQLGLNTAERLENYRTLFSSHVEDELLDNIRKASNKGLVLGNDRFVDEMENLSGRRLKERHRGRPKKNVL
jgi:putative transposase